MPIGATALIVLALSGTVAGSPAIDTADAQAKLTLKSRITTAGVGPIKIGMTIPQARLASGRNITVRSEVHPGCGHDTVHPLRYGISTLTRHGRIAVLYINKRSLATRSGVRVGDSVAKLRRVYGNQLKARRNIYGTRIYEIRDGNREVQFSTYNGRLIHQIATGRKPEVDWPEGCA